MRSHETTTRLSRRCAVGRGWYVRSDLYFAFPMRHLPPQELTDEQRQAFEAIPVYRNPITEAFMKHQNDTPTIAGERTQLEKNPLAESRRLEFLMSLSVFDTREAIDDAMARTKNKSTNPNYGSGSEAQSENLGSERGGLLHNGKTAKEWFDLHEVMRNDFNRVAGEKKQLREDYGRAIGELERLDWRIKKAVVTLQSRDEPLGVKTS